MLVAEVGEKLRFDNGAGSRTSIKADINGLLDRSLFLKPLSRMRGQALATLSGHKIENHPPTQQ